MTKQQYLLACMMTTAECCNYCVENLTPADFAEGVERDLFDAFVAIRKNGQELGYISLDLYLSGDTEEAIKRQNTLNDAINKYVADAMINMVSHPFDWEVYAKEIIKARNDKTFWDAVDAAKQSSDPISGVQAALDRAVNNNAALCTEIEDTPDAAGIVDMLTSRLDIPMLSTGLCSLDKCLDGGFARSRTYCVGARTSQGKSALLLQCAVYSALQGNVVVYFSLEMPKHELYTRIIAQYCAIPKFDLKDNLDPDKLKILDKLKGHLYICDNVDMSVMDIIAFAKAVKRKAGRLDMVCVDYVQLVKETPNAGRRSRTEALGEITTKLKWLAMEEDVVVFSAAQLSRDADKRGGDAELYDFKSSASIEEDSDGCLLLSLSDAKDKAQIKVAKNRGGATGSIDLCFVAPLTRFCEYL